MNPLLFECPRSGRYVNVGVAIDYAALRKVQPVSLRLMCPVCAELHQWKLAEGLIGEPVMAIDEPVKGPPPSKDSSRVQW